MAAPQERGAVRRQSINQTMGTQTIDLQTESEEAGRDYKQAATFNILNVTSEAP